MVNRAEKLINKFNSLFPVGSQCHWRSVGKDGVAYEVVTVKNAAYDLHGQPVAFFEGKSGCCSIDENFVNYNILVEAAPKPAAVDAQSVDDKIAFQQAIRAVLGLKVGDPTDYYISGQDKSKYRKVFDAGRQAERERLKGDCISPAADDKHSDEGERPMSNAKMALNAYDSGFAFGKADERNRIAKELRDMHDHTSHYQNPCDMCKYITELERVELTGESK